MNLYLHHKVNHLILEDFEIGDDSIDEPGVEEARNELDQIIGQNAIKTFLSKVETQIRYEKKTKTFEQNLRL